MAHERGREIYPVIPRQPIKVQFIGACQYRVGMQAEHGPHFSTDLQHLQTYSHQLAVAPSEDYKAPARTAALRPHLLNLLVCFCKCTSQFKNHPLSLFPLPTQTLALLPPNLPCKICNHSSNGYYNCICVCKSMSLPVGLSKMCFIRPLLPEALLQHTVLPGLGASRHHGSDFRCQLMPLPILISFPRDLHLQG